MAISKDVVKTTISQLKQYDKSLQAFLIKNHSTYISQYSTVINEEIKKISSSLTETIINKRSVDYTAQLQIIAQYYHTLLSCGPILDSISINVREKRRIIESYIQALQPRLSFGFMFQSSSIKREVERVAASAAILLNGNFANDVASKLYQLDHPEVSQIVFDVNVYSHDSEFTKKFNNICASIYFLCLRSKKFLEMYESSVHTAELQRKIKDDVSIIQQYENRQAAIDELKNISIEQIRNARKGFPVAKLQRCGFSNAWQLFDVSESSLEAIDGIGPMTAHSLKDYVNNLYQSLLSATSIKLQVKQNDPNYSRLIKDIYELYLKSTFVRSINKEYVEQVKAATEYLVKNNNYNIFLLNQSQMQQIYAYVEFLKDKTYPELKLPTINEAWEHFSKQPVLYTGALEKLCPNIFGQDDSKEVIASELLKKIEGFELNLEGFRCQLRSYQFFGAKYMLHQKRVLLGDEMGLGKTVEALAALVHLWNSGKKHFILFCSLTIVENWKREIKRFTDIPSYVFSKSKYFDRNRFVNEGGILLVSYGRNPSTYFGDMDFDVCISDEAHFIKNPYAARTKTALKILNKSDYKFLMTGTPIENRVSEMTWLISILNPQLASELEKNSDISQSIQFKKLASAVYFRRTTEQVALELPDLIESDEWLQLNDDERCAYEINIMSHNWMQARQMSFLDVSINNSAKISKIIDLCKNAISENRKVLVFSFFRNTLAQLKAAFGKYAIGPISGETPVRDRQKIIDQFSEGESPILLAQIITGGTGLNIQAASVVIFCEPQYKPSIEEQATARAHRMGQSRNVLAFHLLTEDTIEERIKNILDKKRKIFEEFADQSESGIESIAIDRALQEELEKEEYENVVNNKENARKAMEELKKMEVDDNRVQNTNPTQESKDKERKKMTDKLRWCILLRDNCICQVCGASTKTDKNVKLEVDHIIPISKGGRTVPANLQTLCHKCNMGKMTDTYDAKV